MSTFFQWFDEVSAKAKASEVGQLMAANNFQISHTGGGCLAWERRLGNETYLWVCDEGNGLGDSLTESYLVGHYRDGDEIATGETDSLQAAIDWVNARD